MNKLYW